jgi:hypothetical protein
MLRSPKASLYFYTAFDGMADFANGITKLQEEGCQVIVDDVTYFAQACVVGASAGHVLYVALVQPLGFC